MTTKSIIQETALHIRNLSTGESSGHDWWHIFRVWRIAKTIATEEKADMFVVELSALLHDIADHKNHSGDVSIGSRKAREWLARYDIETSIVNHICQIIYDIPYTGDPTPRLMQTLEGKIIQDADRLDAMGAVGIARAFAYGGKKGTVLYDPVGNPVDTNNLIYNLKKNGPTINHFYEKLFLLKDKMNTAYAKKLAEGRHAFMQLFLERFYDEWNGIK
jgi:uncharacterized protein